MYLVILLCSLVDCIYTFFCLQSQVNGEAVPKPTIPSSFVQSVQKESFQVGKLPLVLTQELLILCKVRV